MASSAQQLPPTFTSAETWQERIETHETFMRKAASAQTTLDYKKLNELHEKIVGLVTCGLNKADKADLTFLLNTRWCSLIEEEEERIWISKGELSEARVCIYLSDEWVYVVAYTKKLGSTNVTFGNPKANKPGFQVRIRESNGKLCWGHDYDNLTKDEQGNTHSIGDIFGHIDWAVRNGKQKSRELIAELFQRVKEYVDVSMEESISEIIMITQNIYNFKELTFLRECCLKANFKKIILIRETSPTAYRIFSKLSQGKQNLEPISFLVIHNLWDDTRLEVLGFDMSGGDINAVRLLTAATGTYYDLTSVKNAYGRAIARLSIPQRNSIRYHVLTNEYSHSFFTELKYYLRDEKKLKKADNLSTNDNILELLPQLSINPSKLIKLFLGQQSSQEYKSPANKCDKPIVGVAKPHPRGNNDRPPEKANIPLKTEGGRGFSAAPEPPVAAGSTGGIKKEIVATSRMSITETTTKPKHITTPTNIKREVTGKGRVSAKEKLLETCKNMEQQMSDRTVSIGALNKRVVTESIKQARLAVSEDMMGSPEETDLYELFKSLGFKETPTKQAFPLESSSGNSCASLDDDAKYPSESQEHDAILIGNCLARSYGIEPTEGIKLKSLVVKIDEGVATMGEVVSTCTIKGLGNTVYVGVKFRKHLGRGSTGIKIKHAPGSDGYCEECKGRKYVFIPRQHIGHSKDSLFQVQ